MRLGKRKKRGGEKEKSKSLEILLSAHSRTSQADILHLDQKATKCIRTVISFVVSFSS